MNFNKISTVETVRIDRVKYITYLWSQYGRHFVGQDRRTVCS